MLFPFLPINFSLLQIRNSTESIAPLGCILVVNHIKGLAKIWPLGWMWTMSHTHLNEVLKAIISFVTPRNSRLVTWEWLILLLTFFFYYQISNSRNLEFTLNINHLKHTQFRSIILCNVKYKNIARGKCVQD